MTGPLLNFILKSVSQIITLICPELSAPGRVAGEGRRRSDWCGFAAEQMTPVSSAPLKLERAVTGRTCEPFVAHLIAQ